MEVLGPVVTPARLGRRTFLMTAIGGLTVLSAPGLWRPLPQAWAEMADSGGLARVLIRRGDSSVDAPSITVSGDGEVAVTDGNGELILKAPARKDVTVGRDGDAFWVDDGEKRTGLAGPIRFNGTGDGAPLRNQSTSSGEPTPYRGTLEVTASPDNQVALVNVLGLEEYLYGVVTKELPALFGAEPLKAQAVAARTYTLSRREQVPHKSQNADVCDTQHCQAFGGLYGEHAAGREAVDATRGKVLYVAGALFQPLYASACGGHTETASRIYGNGDDSGTDAVPDGELPTDLPLSTDEGALKFYKGNWDSYCSGSDRYRWSYSWDAEQLKAIVSSGIQRFRGTQTVSSSETDGRVEMLDGVTVTERGPSGRAISVRFEAPGVSWTVKRDWGIRNFLKTPEGNLLPSSAVAFEIERDPDKKLTRLTAFGAGWGHGAGLCQWGTKGLAARGMSFEQILAHYYPSAELGDADTGNRTPLAPMSIPTQAAPIAPPPKPAEPPATKQEPPQATPAPAPAPAPTIIPPPRTAPGSASTPTPAPKPGTGNGTGMPGMNGPVLFPR
jgi:SpoIID/LytB domain protein